MTKPNTEAPIQYSEWDRPKCAHCGKRLRQRVAHKGDGRARYCSYDCGLYRQRHLAARSLFTTRGRE